MERRSLRFEPLQQADESERYAPDHEQLPWPATVHHWLISIRSVQECIVSVSVQWTILAPFGSKWV